MCRKYTAQEMRQRADMEQYLWNDSTTAAMLRQAADAMEREEKRKQYHEYIAGCSGVKREKKYEYVCYGHVFHTFNGAMIYSIENECQGQRPTIVRREVGEWEEVK